MFHVGQLVVCVDDRREAVAPPRGVAWNGNLDGLCRGRIYTVRDVGDDIGIFALWLEEIRRRRSVGSGKEAGFAAVRFRPVDSSRLSIFTAMLEDAPEPVVPLVTA